MVGLTKLVLGAVLFLTGGQETPTSQYNLECITKAIAQVESSNNPNAERYEKHLDSNPLTHLEDTSYGVAQFIPTRARELERRFDYLPRLGQSEDEIIRSLKNPEINLVYLKANLDEAMVMYGKVDLAIAAHNSGLTAPRNARIQEMLNEVIGTSLKTDGIIGKKTKLAITKFQRTYGIKATGRLDSSTLERLRNTWRNIFPDSENVAGIVPKNGTTEFYVHKVLKYCDQDSM